MKIIHLPPDYEDQKNFRKRFIKRVSYDPRIQPTTKIFGLNPQLVKSRANPQVYFIFSFLSCPFFRIDPFFGGTYRQLHHSKQVAVWVADDSKPEYIERAAQIAEQLQLNLVRTKAEARQKYSFLLGVDSQKIFLQHLGTVFTKEIDKKRFLD